MDYSVHESSYVDSGAQIGNGTAIGRFCHIMGTAIIGRDCQLGQNVYVDAYVSIGNNCNLQNNVSVYRHVTLESQVFCGSSVVFTNVWNPRAQIKKMDHARPTLIKEGARLGANCTIVCGNSVGRYAFVGAGAVVTHNVPDHAIVYGNPAIFSGWVCVCGHKIDDSLICPECSRRYEHQEQGLVLINAT